MAARRVTPDTGPRKGLAHDFPLRPDFLAQLVLPIDLTEKEARRLAAFMLALAQEEPPLTATDVLPAFRFTVGDEVSQ